MNTWAPLFSRIVDSSLWREEDWVIKIFITMIARKDADQVVRASAFMIGEWAKKPEAEVLKALKILSSPDKKRLEPQPFEGRRIEKRPDGWLILNGLLYEDLMRSINRKAYKARKQREYRAAGKPLNGETETLHRLSSGQITQEQADERASLSRERK
jgi:hypothetical protein